MVSQELGSDMGKTHTWKPPDQSSLHDLCRTGIRPKPMQTCISPKDNRRSKPFSLNTNRFGGAERDRTADPLLAKQVLSQLSYSPISSIAPNIAVQGFGKLPRQVISFPTLIPSREWWAREDLNFRPHAYQACALTN